MAQVCIACGRKVPGSSFCPYCLQPMVECSPTSSPRATLTADHLFAVRGFLLVLALYVPYFFLPVLEYEGPVLGAHSVLVCFLVPAFWPIALGHMALWFGALSLLRCRWQTAKVAALVALVASYESWIYMFLAWVPGQYMKLASMLVLGGVAWVGTTRFGLASRDSKEREKIVSRPAKHTGCLLLGLAGLLGLIGVRTCVLALFALANGPSGYGFAALCFSPLVLALILLGVGIAKRVLPPAPDRFPPSTAEQRIPLAEAEETRIRADLRSLRGEKRIDGPLED